MKTMSATSSQNLGKILSFLDLERKTTEVPFVRCRIKPRLAQRTTRTLSSGWSILELSCSASLSRRAQEKKIYGLEHANAPHEGDNRSSGSQEWTSRLVREPLFAWSRLDERDSKGEAVRAVRTEQSWPREVAREAASTQQVEATDKSSVAYRNSQRPAHRKRTAFIQRGAALQRAGKGHESSTRKKKRKSGEASATSAAAEMPNLIETLFLGAKTTSNNADVSLANTSATFARLRPQYPW
ncbi:uncharacterized protein PITG_14449 [Phytophthora infestans T30-4]|uniref:Uncharacterized protein n=1 Tax=Phytophthora infestans (strain T30-4) TaxID=403677 RepID=D0NPV7_PHYIT|nr:uncharacterized protein PITG_14449 [Phytophthora infestans T30-4]EEY62669.1 conserved hypothetical protein [Phytophthora infestans T30-4]|eukprot:XP_002898911.1 conserved hypothetical protein [Phytophthora infestans T30-4]